MSAKSKPTLAAALFGAAMACFAAVPDANAGASTGTWQNCRPYCGRERHHYNSGRDGLYHGRDFRYGDRDGLYHGRDGRFGGRDGRYGDRDGLYGGRDYRYGPRYHHRRYYY